jgi:hypothetical protein
VKFTPQCPIAPAGYSPAFLAANGMRKVVGAVFPGAGDCICGTRGYNPLTNVMRRR